MKLWKSLAPGMKSQVGDLTAWEIGKWKKHDGPLKIHAAGFHAAKNVIDAMHHAPPNIIALVEAKGEHLEQDNIQVWSEMRVLRAWEWKKEDSIELAIYAAELVIEIFEKIYSEKGPRKAIEAAKSWLNDPSEENRQVAKVAAIAAIFSAREAIETVAREKETLNVALKEARAAWNAVWASWNAAWTAYQVTARAAAWEAAKTVQAAAEAAAEAEGEAAREEIMKKCNEWVLSKLAAKNSYKNVT